jgi:hypothetical protein
MPSPNFGVCLRSLTSFLAIMLIAGCIGDDRSAIETYADQAVEAKNPDLCLKLGQESDKDQCLELVGKALKDSGACNRIKNESASDSCATNVAIEARNFTSCSDVKAAKQRIQCLSIVGLAKASDALEALKNIISPAEEERINYDEISSETCAAKKTQDKKDECYNILAGKTDNQAFCKSIKSASLRDPCYNNIAAHKGDDSLCKLMEASGRDSCLLNVAGLKRDIAICDDIGSDMLRTKCQTELAQVVDSNSCRGIRDQSAKDGCYYSFAVKNNQPSLCREIIDYTRGQNCLSEIGNTNADESICAMIAAPGLADNCYYHVATTKSGDNKPLCNKIKDQNRRNICIKNT